MKMDITAEEYKKYVINLEDKQFKKHTAEQFLDGQSDLKDIKETLFKITEYLNPKQIYEQYKLNKKQYKEEVEDSLLRKSSLVTALKNITVSFASIGIVVLVFLDKIGILDKVGN